MPEPDARAEAFLREAEAFRLGDLETERPHPRSRDLSRQANEDLPGALDTLRAIDLEALDRASRRLGPGDALAEDVRGALAAGSRVFLAGCGATGRLSVSLECLAREGMLPEPAAKGIAGFMAGGDAALIRSIEGFEDHPDYGARQLRERGFRGDDLLIACTEGGETPWVIGAAEAAADAGGRAPWFVYGNPDDALRAAAERSRRVLDRPDIRKWNLAAGPMALAGSTRMQASTVLMLGIGLALRAGAGPEDATGDSVAAPFERFRRYFRRLDWRPLAPLVQGEAERARQGGRVLYRSAEFGLAVLTDTTERAPTFSLAPFENKRAETAEKRSLAGLAVPGARDTREAWRRLLGRAPRCLEWPECRAFTGEAWLEGYRLDDRAEPGAAVFQLDRDAEGLRMALGECVARFPAASREARSPGEAKLFHNLALKALLNAHSTLVMGRLGRYRNNLMLYVRASNGKLIDRAIRYVRLLFEREHGRPVDYATAYRAVFRALDGLGDDEPAVLRALARLKSGDGTSSAP